MFSGSWKMCESRLSLCLTARLWILTFFTVCVSNFYCVKRAEKMMLKVQEMSLWWESHCRPLIFTDWIDWICNYIYEKRSHQCGITGWMWGDNQAQRNGDRNRKMRRSWNVVGSLFPVLTILCCGIIWAHVRNNCWWYSSPASVRRWMEMWGDVSQLGLKHKREEFGAWRMERSTVRAVQHLWVVYEVKRGATENTRSQSC